MSSLPNAIHIKKRLFEIKKNQKKIPIIDFGLRLDAYHVDDNCLHCRKGIFNNHIFTNAMAKRK